MNTAWDFDGLLPRSTYYSSEESRPTMIESYLAKREMEEERHRWALTKSLTGNLTGGPIQAVAHWLG